MTGALLEEDCPGQGSPDVRLAGPGLTVCLNEMLRSLVLVCRRVRLVCVCLCVPAGMWVSVCASMNRCHVSECLGCASLCAFVWHQEACKE